MSHRVTTNTKITNKDLATDALKMAGWQYSVNGNMVSISSGPMNRATIDLGTGVVAGDTDIHGNNDDSLGALKRYYAEAEVREQAHKQGLRIESRKVLDNGEVELLVQYG